jgi:hypothetical protein
METPIQAQRVPSANANQERALVNPIALQHCSVRLGDVTTKILDISFVRIVLDAGADWPALPEKEAVTLEFTLERHTFPVVCKVIARGEAEGGGWVRCGFDKLVPSAQAHLRSFLSPKKIGESIVEDWRTDEIRHFHGLNESEMWFHSSGVVVFTYLDSTDGGTQFFVRMMDSKGPLEAGRVSRRDYMAMEGLDAPVSLSALNDRETYARLGECRDIITNFRPTGQIEYNLKQKLLKVVSDTLYSTSHRVDFTPVRPPKVVTLPVES